MVQVQDWSELTKALSANLRELRLGAPEVMKAFGTLATTASAGNALDAKTKELMALAIAVSARCDDCIAFHVKAALDRGATREEVMETLGVAIYMGGGPSTMYAGHALAAYSQFSAAAKPPG
jgi:AhpD family alkylhydroperoxidase